MSACQLLAATTGACFSDDACMTDRTKMSCCCRHCQKLHFLEAAGKGHAMHDHFFSFVLIDGDLSLRTAFLSWVRFVGDVHKEHLHCIDDGAMAEASVGGILFGSWCVLLRQSKEAMIFLFNEKLMS